MIFLKPWLFSSQRYRNENGDGGAGGSMGGSDSGGSESSGDGGGSESVSDSGGFGFGDSNTGGFSNAGYAADSAGGYGDGTVAGAESVSSAPTFSGVVNTFGKGVGILGNIASIASGNPMGIASGLAGLGRAVANSGFSLGSVSGGLSSNVSGGLSGLGSGDGGGGSAYFRIPETKVKIGGTSFGTGNASVYSASSNESAEALATQIGVENPGEKVVIVQKDDGNSGSNLWVLLVPAALTLFGGG